MKKTPSESYFPEDRTIVLPGLDEQLTLPAYTFFRDDGAVPSLPRNLAKTMLTVNGHFDMEGPWYDNFLDRMMKPFKLWAAEDAILAQNPNYATDAGYCHAVPLRFGRKGYVIAVRDGMNKSNTIFAKGHESGELLMRLEMRDYLQGCLQDAGVDLDIRPFEGEDFADIAGVLALKKALEKGERNLKLPVIETRGFVNKRVTEAFALKF